MSKSTKCQKCNCEVGTSCKCPPELASLISADEDTLETMRKFKRFYEDKLKQIDIEGGGDCELKLQLQERWINDLTEQTEMMARIVKELEDEATMRVRMLEDKLKQTSKAAYEVMKRYQTYNVTHNLDEPFQKVYYLENDLKNVLEFVRRIRDDGKWSVEGLQFYEITYDDLFGRSVKEEEVKEKNICNNYASLERSCNGMETTEKEENTTSDNEKPNYKELLKKKNEEYEALRRSMLDMRSALAEEVACKHDMILALKKDILQLEERCLQADKQTAFKDDIIKELRKEMKQLKQQLKKEHDEKKSEEVENLERKLKEAEAKIRRMRPCVEMKTVCTVMDDFLACKEKELEKEICCRQREVNELKDKCQALEKALSSSRARGENLQKAEEQCAARNEVKKLRRQKRCYEHVLECFKHEMAVMSEQLANLQEILKISNASCKEESGQLCGAIADLQQVTYRLKMELKEAERKIVIENQMNQLKDAKIDELQMIIGQKNADLTVHDEAINEMKRRLENALIENHELQATIVSLNSTIMQLQCAPCLQHINKEKEKSKTCVDIKKSMDSIQAEMDKKEKKLNKLQKDYVAQYEILQKLQEEFDRYKEKNKEKVKALKHQNESLKDKLETSETNNQKMVHELSNLKEQTALVAQKDTNREHELAQCKQIILELRQTLIELNDNLANSELQQMACFEEYKKRIMDHHEDIYLSCQCEIAMYKKLVENLKDTLLKMKRKIADFENEKNQLHEELKHRDMKITELQKKLCRKEKEAAQNVRELTEKLQQAHEEEKRLSDFIEKLQEQVRQNIMKNNENKYIENDIACSCMEQRRDEVTATNQEISALKIEIKRMIQNQLALNSENDKLLKQVSCLQSTHLTLDERNRHLRHKIELYQEENQKLKETLTNLLRETEISAQTIRNLEAEIAELRNNRDDICAESRQVVNNVKCWLEEQKSINDKVKKRSECYCQAIAKLQEENKNLQNQVNSCVRDHERSRRSFKSYSPPPPQLNNDCRNAWCFGGSQGNDSPRDSPSSFQTCSIEEWYSPNYRDETDFESDNEDEFVSRLEAVALEMKNNNKKWREKYKECECLMVSKDDK